MDAHLHMLHGLLVVSFALAPIMTRHFFLDASKPYRAAHALAFVLAILAIAFDLPALSGAWLAFCLFGFGLFLRASLRGRRTLPPLTALAPGVPLAFSIIAATWFFCGANDLRLLGYGRSFSYYAALHGNVLGWMFGGCIAALVRRRVRFYRAHFACLLLTLLSFLLIAYGIDGVAIIKPIGVAGLTIAISGTLLLFLIGAYGVSKAAFACGLLSLASLAVTMTLAWQNELGAPVVAHFLGVRAMVSVHGLVNGLIAAPAFMAAVVLLGRATPACSEPGATPSTGRSPHR